VFGAANLPNCEAACFFLFCEQQSIPVGKYLSTAKNCAFEQFFQWFTLLYGNFLSKLAASISSARNFLGD